jgi:c-di-GMP-related signal transduction protein
MSELSFIVREPLLDSKQKVLGFELTWQKSGAKNGKLSDQDVIELIGFVADQFNNEESGWLMGDQVLFLDVPRAVLFSGVLSALAPKSIVLTLDLSSSDEEMVAEVKALREQGFGISLRDAETLIDDKALLPLITHVQARFDNSDFAVRAKFYGALKQASVQVVMRELFSWEEYDTCAALGLDGFAGDIYLTPRPGVRAKGLNPAQAMILQLMEMVRQNADVHQLESVLRRDAALSYKLLRYINSVGFGLGAEIQSLRHAVTMLGYSPLYRWLSLLLATASTAGQSPVLMQTAIIRGRFAELLGHGLLPKNEAENLFVAGMFSLLDKLLGVSMPEVLESIQLSDSVAQALLSRSGIYGPFLALAEACEIGNGQVGEKADALFVSPRQVNEAQLAALAWAQNLKL